MPAAALVLLLGLLATVALGPAALAEEDETVVGPAATELSIERRVEGEAPPGARFVVALACDELDRVELEVDAGGIRSLPVPQGQECELTEVDDGGATSGVIAVAGGAATEGRSLAFATGDHAELTVVVTSRFAAGGPEAEDDAPGSGGPEAVAGEEPEADGTPAEAGSSTPAAEDDTGVRDAGITTPSRVDAGGGGLSRTPLGVPVAVALLAVAGLAGAALGRRRA